MVPRRKINALKAIKKAVNTVGVMEVSKPVSWKIVPNPANQIIQLDGEISEFTSIQIINLNGQVVGTFIKGDQINVSDLLNGFYILRLQSGNKVEQQTFIKE